MLRNVTIAELDAERVGTIVCASVFLTTRHNWNVPCGDAYANGWAMAETLVFEAQQVLRRPLVQWMRQKASQQQLDDVCDAVMRVSGPGGALLGSPADVLHRWAHVTGDRHSALFAVLRTRCAAPGDELYDLYESSSVVEQIAPTVKADTLLDLGV